MMEIQNAFFTARHKQDSCSNFYSLAHSSHTSDYWSEELQPTFALTDDVLLMQHLRFPTPPITPPRGCYAVAGAAQSEYPVQERTQSVIMKVGHDNSLRHLSVAATEISTLDVPKVDLSKTTSSESSSPCNEYFCDWNDCGRYFESLQSLAAHVTQLHAIASYEDGLYYCRWKGCLRTERGFNARYKMLVHVRTHTKEKPHKCHLCQKSFSRAENLKIHIRSHSGEKPYVCTFEGCFKRYSNSSDRFKHTRTHSIEKPYMCKVPGCQKRYTDPSSLRKHVKTFKHEMQLMSTFESKKQEQKSQTANYFYAHPTPLTDFYMQSSRLENFNEMHNTDFESYALHTNGVAGRWYENITESVSPQTTYSIQPHKSVNIAINIELHANPEVPLDLRVNRR